MIFSVNILSNIGRPHTYRIINDNIISVKYKGTIILYTVIPAYTAAAVCTGSNVNYIHTHLLAAVVAHNNITVNR